MLGVVRTVMAKAAKAEGAFATVEGTRVLKHLVSEQVSQIVEVPQ